ncbi:MAG: 30S ribosomal protein S6 [Planctomycetota bacterium]|nr:30S ribosomal protein S6 [Planctomycetota bacterium]
MSDTTRIYESMFLVSQSEAADLGGIVAYIEEILRRGDAEVIAMKKWDERRLAYEIEKQRRGVYFLCYFRAPTGSITHIERDCTLSERIMRVLILNAEHLSDEDIAACDDRAGLGVEANLRKEEADKAAAAEAAASATAAAAASAEAAPAATEEAPAETTASE